jgi:hypothetical protein
LDGIMVTAALGAKGHKEKKIAKAKSPFVIEHRQRGRRPKNAVRASKEDNGR